MQLLALGQEITGTFVKLKTSISTEVDINDVLDFTPFTLALDIVKNDAINIELKIFWRDKNNSDRLYPFPIQDLKKNRRDLRPEITRIHEDWFITDNTVIVPWEFDQNLSDIEIHIRAITPGATKAVVTRAQFETGYVQ